MPYLFTFILKNSIVVILTCVILAQTNPFYVKYILHSTVTWSKFALLFHYKKSNYFLKILFVEELFLSQIIFLPAVIHLNIIHTVNSSSKMV